MFISFQFCGIFMTTGDFGHKHERESDGDNHRRLQAGTAEDAWAMKLDEGSWLLDGFIPIPELKTNLALSGWSKPNLSIPNPAEH